MQIFIFNFLNYRSIALFCCLKFIIHNNYVTIKVENKNKNFMNMNNFKIGLKLYKKKILYYLLKYTIKK